jgi:hypothetical protein
MRFLPLLLSILLITGTARAETRIFVSLAGTLLEAEITAVAGDNVTLKRVSDEQPLVVSRKTLCKEDNAFITRWIEQNPEKALAPAAMPASTPAPLQKYSLACQTLPSKSNRGPPDGGEHVVELSYKFNISNREVRRDLEKASGIVITLGKNTGEGGNDLIVLQKEIFDVNIPAQSKMVHSTTPVRLTYYQGTPAYGVKSYGYVLIIRDSAGNVLFVESSPDSTSKFTKEIDALEQVPCVVDRDFKLKPASDVPSSYISF